MSEYEGRCGGCGAFTRVRTDDKLGRIGECALNVFPPPLRANSTCSRYRPKGGAAPPPPPRAAGEPRGQRTLPMRRADGTGGAAPRTIARSLPDEVDIDMEMNEFRRVLREVLAEELGIGEAEIAGRWEGGEIVLKPGREGTQEKRIPLEIFFKKIVTLRDKLRVLEQKINGHDQLTSADKVQLQQYITGCYGSLTTFNLLFANRDDAFVGAGKDE